MSNDTNKNWSWAIEGSPRENAKQNSQDILESKYDGIYLCGGGMWQVSFYGTSGMPEEIEEMFFSGVCVSETPESLHCRGPESLYQVFTKYLDSMT